MENRVDFSRNVGVAITTEMRRSSEDKTVTVEVSQELATLLELPSRIVDIHLPLTEQQHENLNRVDKQGNTQIHTAAKKGDKGSLEFLIQQGVDVNYLNRSRQRAIDIVWEMENYDCMLLLLEGDSNFPEFFKPCQVDEIVPTPNELKLFIEQRNRLHEWIKQKNVKNLNEYVSQHRLSRFLSTEGVPAIETASKYGNSQMLAALLKLPFTIEPGKIILAENAKNILNLEDDDRNTPLLLAAESGNEEIVDFLIRCGAKINFTNKANKKAVDLAWENGHFNVVLLLLKEDSSFPKGFPGDALAGKDGDLLLSFTSGRDRLHSFIRNGNLQEVKSFIDSDKQASEYYLNSRDVSALAAAIDHRRYEVYSLLVSRGLHFKDQQEAGCLEQLDEEAKTELNNYMVRYFTGAENSSIFYLISKSKSMRPRENFENEVKRFYSELSRIPKISAVLQVLQYADNVEIVFDFDRDDVSHMDPRHAATTKGTTEFKSGRLYVGFKSDDPLQESERLGTLAHELAHIAMQIIYNNDCNPYCRYDEDKRNEFEEVVRDVKKHCDSSGTVDDIISRVFVDYKDENHWPAELIVRVPHILAKYGTVEGEDILRTQASALLSFYSEHVMRTCSRFVRDSFLVKPRNMMRLLNQHLGVAHELERTNIWFDQPYDLNTFLHDQKHNILLLGTPSTLLSSISVYQSLQHISQDSLENSTLMLKLHPSKDIQNDIIHTFRSQACNVMVVEYHHDDGPQLESFLSELYHVFRETRKKKVILIAISDALPSIILACKTAKLTPRLVEDHDKEFTLKDLSSKSQKILLDRTVNFQGCSIALNNLLYNKHETLMDSETLTKLVKKEEIIVGNKISELGGIKNYYIVRRLNINEEVSENIFDDEEINDWFFLTGSCDDLISNNVKVHKNIQHSSETEDEQFSKFCVDHSKTNVHWLKRYEGKLFWIKTKGSISGVTKHRIAYKRRTYSVNEALFENTRQKVAVISDTAGMGKSTLMVKLAETMKHNSPKMWIERIDLNDFNEELSELNEKKNNFKIDEESATEFLMHKILKYENVFEQNLFAKYIETENAVTLLFDGFDEISPVYTDIVIRLLKALKKTRIDKLYVTTRPTMTPLLEEELCVFSHSIVPFTEENKSDFLVQFWRHRFNLANTQENQRLENYAAAIMNKLSTSLNDRETKFTGIPLQMRMIAEIFPENEEFDENDLLQNFDLLTLYELFIYKKYHIYKKEKVKPITAIAEDEVEQSRSISIQNHQKLALHNLFPNDFSRLVSDDESENLDSYISRITHSQERTGIINNTQLVRGTIRLLVIHRSFSEYFVADFIVSRLRRGKHNLEIQRFLLSEILTAPLNGLIRNFFNARLARQPLEKAVLDQFGEIITEVWSSDRTKLCNENEETILHVAVKERNDEIISFILSSLENSEILKKFIDGEDSGGLSATHEAVKIGNLKVVEWLVENGADVNAVDNDGNTVLYYALRYKHSQLADFLMDRGADVKTIDAHSLYRYLNDWPQRLEVIKMLVDKGADIKAKDKYGETLLHFAAEQGDMELIQWLVENGKANVNDEDSDGTKLIHRSASNDQWELVKWLVQHGNADANVKDRVGNTLSHYAAFKGRLDIVQWLVKPKDDGGGGAEISTSGELGSSVLHDAALSGNTDLVKWLVTSTIQKGGGLDINIRDEDGRTPLHEAAFSGHYGLVRWMVEELQDGGGGADVNVTDNDGETALYRAASFGQLNIVQLLWDKIDNHRICDKEGRTILHVAAAFGEVNLIEKLLESGKSDVNTVDKHGRSALHYAAEHNNHDVVGMLLDRGASVDFMDKGGRRAIHFAASTGTRDIEEWLKDRYVDVDWVTGLEGNSHEARKKICFSLAPHQQHIIKFLEDKNFEISHENNGKFHLTLDALSTMKLLVQRGCDINAIDSSGKTALYDAVFLTDRDVVGWHVVQWLMQPTAHGGGGADVTTTDNHGRTMLHEVAKHGETIIFDNLLDMLPDGAQMINIRDNDGRTPLHEAAENYSVSQSDMIKLLIENGADVNTPDNKGRTALHEASKYGHLDCVKIMLDPDIDPERRANVDARDMYGRTPLHDACAAGNLKIAKFSVLNKADINSKDKDGRTPLHHAALSNKLKVVRWLMENEVINYKDKSGKTAFDLANENKFEDVVNEMIKEHFDSDSTNVFADLLQLNEQARNLELNPLVGTSSSNGCSYNNRKRRHIERCYAEEYEYHFFPYEPLEDTVPVHLSRSSNMYTQISMAAFFETSGYLLEDSKKEITNVLHYNMHLGDIVSEGEVNQSLREKKVLHNHYEDVHMFFEMFPEKNLLGKYVCQIDLVSAPQPRNLFFDNGRYTALLLKFNNRYLLYSQDLNYRIIFQTRGNISFDHISKFFKSFFKWRSGSSKHTVYTLAPDLPSGLIQHVKMAKPQRPRKVVPDNVLLATKYSGIIEYLPAEIVAKLFLLRGKTVNISQLHQSFFSDNKNAITIRLDKLSDVLLHLQSDEAQAVFSVVRKYSIPVDYKIDHELSDEEKLLLEVYRVKVGKFLKTSSVMSAENLSKISWDSLNEGLSSHPSISSELAGKVLTSLKEIHKTSSAVAVLKGMATQTLFFLPDIIRSVNYGDTSTVVQMGAMLTGDTAANHLYNTAVSKLSAILPIERSQLLSKLPVTSPIFKAVTIYSIIELHKQLQTPSVSLEERKVIKHKLVEQYITLGLMAADLLGFELTPLWIGLIVEQLIFDAKTLREHYHINVSLWEAFLMSLGFEQGKLQTILEERNLAITNLEMINKLSNHHKVLYGWAIVKIPQVGEVEWRNIEESLIPSEAKENVISHKPTFSPMPLVNEVFAADGFRMIKVHKQRKQVLYGTATITRGKLIRTLWQKAFYRANGSKTHIMFSPDDDRNTINRDDNNCFLNVYSGDVSNWQRVYYKSNGFCRDSNVTEKSEAIKKGNNIIEPIKSANNVAVYVNNNTFSDPHAQRNLYFAFDPREGDTVLHFTLPGTEHIEKFNCDNNVHANQSDTVDSDAHEILYQLNIQIGYKFYPDCLEFPNGKGEFVLRDDSHKIFSHYIIAGNMEYSIKDSAHITSIDFVPNKPNTATSNIMCNEINGGPIKFSIDTWQCLKETTNSALSVRNLHHVNSALMVLSGSKMYLRFNQGDHTISHSLALSALHIDLEEVRGRQPNHSKIIFGKEVASFNISLRSNIIIFNQPVSLYLAGEIPIRMAPVYLRKSAHNRAISFYEIEVDRLWQIVLSVSQSEIINTSNSIIDLNFTYCGAFFRWKNEHDTNNTLSIIGRVKDQSASLQINKSYYKLTLLNQDDNSIANVLIINHSKTALLEEELILQAVISSAKLKSVEGYDSKEDISDVISYIFDLVTNFDYIRDILVFKTPRGYKIIHCLPDSTEMHSNNIVYIVQDGVMCATSAKKNIINKHDLIEHSSVDNILQAAVNCGICFRRNLTESHITAGNHSIIVNDLVLKGLKKSTMIYFGPGEAFTVQALEDTFLGRGQATDDRGEDTGKTAGYIGESPGGQGKTLPRTAEPRVHHRIRRRAEDGRATANSGAFGPSSMVNTLFKMLKQKAIEAWNIFPETTIYKGCQGLLGCGHTLSSITSAAEEPRYNVNLMQPHLLGTLSLVDLIVRKISGSKPIAVKEEQSSPLHVQGITLNIIAGFEDLLVQICREENIPIHELVFDPIALQKILVSKLVNGQGADVGEILYNSLYNHGAGNDERKAFIMFRIKM